MNDLLDDEIPQGNTPEFSVSEISGAVKRALEGNFSHVRVKGEVGRVLIARSGHVYFDLKDDRSVISSVAWKGTAAKFQTMPEEGMEVVATGRISTFGGQSKYQLIVERLAPAGVGALMAMLEKRKKALAAEGLFDPERKRPIPYLPEVIGVITSPQGAVIRDILHRLRDRFPRRVLLWPVTVQGEKCAAQVSAAIRGFNALDPRLGLPKPDLLIVARGGGSLEDLWGFNEEVVVRAAADSRIPLISAVGHETDTTLIDFASDKRAPTPTAAAEIAVPVRVELISTLAAYDERRVRGQRRALDARGEKLRDLARALPRPQAILGERQQRFDAIANRLDAALGGLLQSRQLDLARRTGRFGSHLLLGDLTRRQNKLDTNFAALRAGLKRHATRARDLLENRRLPISGMTAKVERNRSELTRMFERINGAHGTSLTRAKDRLVALERIRQTLGYTQTLERGFAVIRNADDGGVVASLGDAQPHAGFEIEFRDGRVDVVRRDASEPPPKPKPLPAKKRTRAAKNDGSQGSLF